MIWVMTGLCAMNTMQLVQSTKKDPFVTSGQKKIHFKFSLAHTVENISHSPRIETVIFGLSIRN